MLPDGYRVTLEHQGSHWWYRARRELFLRQVRRAARALPLGRPPATTPRPLALLDYGCASGFDLECLAALGLGTVEGADIVHVHAGQVLAGPSPPAGAKDGGSGAAAPIHIVPRDLPGLRGRFDIITCLDVLEHLDDDVAGLRTLGALLVPGGQIVATVPAYGWLWSGEDEISQHRRRYTRARLLRVCRAAGFEVLYASYFNLGLLPPMAAVIWWRRLTHPRWRAESNLTAGGDRAGLARAVARFLTALEARAVGGQWVRLPAGASLVCRLRRPLADDRAPPRPRDVAA
jgi:SAM-dependent methyltransferase